MGLTDLVLALMSAGMVAIGAIAAGFVINHFRHMIKENEKKRQRFGHDHDKFFHEFMEQHYLQERRKLEKIEEELQAFQHSVMTIGRNDPEDTGIHDTCLGLEQNTVVLNEQGEYLVRYNDEWVRIADPSNLIDQSVLPVTYRGVPIHQVDGRVNTAEHEETPKKSAPDECKSIW